MSNDRLCKRVVVVGAGVSGCACAAGLASQGVGCVLVNAALDTTGMPGYGSLLGLPDGGDWGKLVRVFAAMPPELRCAWLSGARSLSVGLLVDPRAVSLRVKWVLEQTEIVLLRQGLVTKLETEGSGGQWRLETAFGDVLWADVVVLAVGLALGGRVQVGADNLGGGRYGEVASDDLLASLMDLGLGVHRTSIEVPPLYCGSLLASDKSAGAAKRSVCGVLPEQWVREFREWEAKIWEWEVQARELSLETGRGPAPLLGYGPEAAASSGSGFEAGSGPWSEELGLVPASGCTHEWQAVLDPGAGAGQLTDASDSALTPSDMTVSRLGYRVTGLVLDEVDETGRVQGLDGLWAIGRVAGASSYLESLGSALRASATIGAELRG